MLRGGHAKHGLHYTQSAYASDDRFLYVLWFSDGITEILGNGIDCDAALCCIYRKYSHQYLYLISHFSFAAKSANTFDMANDCTFYISFQW